jgi:hypothetical protein
LIDDVSVVKCPCCAEQITDVKDREISRRVLLLMHDEPTFLKEVNDYRKAFSTSKVNLNQVQDFLMCSGCILAILSGKRAQPPSKKDIYVDKISELVKQPDENSRDFPQTTKKLFPTSNSHLISDEFTVLKVPGVVSPRYGNKIKNLHQT